MGAEAIALRPAIREYIPLPEPQEEDMVPGSVESYPLDGLEIDVKSTLDEPFGGWQIFKKPVLVKDTGKEEGIYLIEFNQEHKDLSIFNNSPKLGRLKFELSSFSSPKLKHLIISFHGCHNTSRTDDIENFLREQRDLFAKHGRRLGLAHFDTTLRYLDSFVHENVPDAVKNRNNHEEKSRPPVPNNGVSVIKKDSYIPPYIHPRLFVDHADPATIETPGNYHG